MISVGIVGIGYWGKNLVRVFSDLASVDYCVHTGNKENEQWMEQNYPSIELTTDYEKVLNDPEVEAVVISTPIDTHYELAKKALRSGKDVFVEKPLADSAEKARNLRDIARTEQRLVFVGFIFCHHPTIQPLLEKSEHTAVQYGTFSWHKLGGFGQDIKLDLVSHPTSMALGLFRKDPSTAEVLHSFTHTESVDHIEASLRFSEEKRFDLKLDRLAPDSRKSLRILYEDGELYNWVDGDLYMFSGRKRDYRLVAKPDQEPLQIECRRFLSALNTGTDALTDAEFGVRVNDALEMF